MPLPAHAIRYPLSHPVDAFPRLAKGQGAVWLDSSLPRAADGRFSILSAEPRWVLQSRDDTWVLRRGNEIIDRGDAGALDKFDSLLNARRVAPSPAAAHLPFFGGAIGWLSYDLGRQFEDINGRAVDDLATPDLWLAWYDTALVYDHAASEGWLVGIETDRSFDLAAAEFASALERREPTIQPAMAPQDDPVSCNMTPTGYMERVAAVRDGIGRGEFYQLNLVQRFSCRHARSAAETYLRLRTENPAPFAAYMDAAPWTVLSSSPERFLNVTPEGKVTTCPIKGTRPRGTTEAEDLKRRAELSASAKERAELLMIVDLLRNDLGRVCVPGSMEVRRLHALESFATVHHLVGEVCGQLRPGTSRSELIRAVFPGGSITGAPKISAMRAIDRLEPHRRGIAMGAIGYFGADGRIDLNIAIRTIILHGGIAHMSVGAGIVWDSDPAAEYAETLAKARALFKALGATPPGP